MELLDQLTTPVLLLDAASLVVHANPAFCAWVGVSRRRWLRLNMQQLGAPALDTLVQQVMSSGQSERIDLLSFQPLPDIEVVARVIVSPLREGAEAKILIEFQIQSDADDAAGRWPEALAATLKGLAHEVRNPLAGLRGAAQLLARRIQDPAERRYIEVIEAETTRLIDLIERLLVPKSAQLPVAVNINQVLERVRLLAEADAAWTCRLVRDYDPSLPSVLGDSDRLLQAVWNLVRNALQANASEVCLRTRIEYGVSLGGDGPSRLAARIDVIDDGSGIADELVPRIFLPLVSGRADGTGLGLAITQEIVRAHGGGIHFKSHSGRTIFSILLPIVDLLA